MKADNVRKALRRRLIIDSGAICHYCGRSGTMDLDPDGRSWTIDRVIPGSKGGDYSPANVVLACWYCNASKSDRPAPRPLPHLRPVCHVCGQWTDRAHLIKVCPCCGQLMPRDKR